MIDLKPNFWNLKDQTLLSFLLQPFTIPIRISNFLLNNKKKYKTKKLKTICIGNIYIGGTGKTPTTIRLYNLLKKNYKDVYTAKKFYDSQIDEFKILKKKTSLLSSYKRKEIVNIAKKRRAKIIIFDDGLQDKDIEYDIKIVCFDTLTWIGNGQLIPSGPLREKLTSLIKYDVVLLKYIHKKNNNIIRLIKKISPEIKIFNTKYIIKNLNEFDLKKNYILFSGIGNPASLKKNLENNKFKIIESIVFPDHYKYTKEDIHKIIEKSKNLNTQILTTEKDYVKIPQNYKKFLKFIKIDLKIDELNKFNKYLKSKINE